ncbi:hypothetical protein BsWGS_10928 [Bradybaena similaris]
MGNNLCGCLEESKDHGHSPYWDLDVDFIRGLRLSKGDIAIVIQFWNIFKVRDQFKSHSVFLISFHRLFIMKPKLQDLFYVTTKPLTIDQWEEYPLFVSHMRRIKTAIGVAIYLLNDDQYVCHEFLKTVACFHQSVGLKKEYIETWVKIFDDELGNSFTELYTDEVRTAFRKVLVIMIDKLTVGLI